MNKSDSQLQLDTEEELRWDPKLNPAKIGVTAKQGTVTLLGTVDTYGEKWAAGDAVRRVEGVHDIRQNLSVKVLTEHIRSDSELAVATQSVFKWNVLVPASVTAKVQDGEITLRGEVLWNFQRSAAELALRCVPGVVNVLNLITLAPQVSAEDVKSKVLAALQRQAIDDAGTIHVQTSGGKVTLTGHASSWQTIEDAVEAAWATSGVTDVSDEVKKQMVY